jgi:hypothetical protein
MRGSPILRAVLVFLALLALAPLLWNLTRPLLAQSEPKPQPEIKSATVEVRLNFSTAAKRVVIQHLGRDVWSKDGPELSEEFSAEIPWPKEGVELRTLVTWPDGTHNAAMRVRLTAPDGTEYDRSAWGSAKADDVLRFP